MGLVGWAGLPGKFVDVGGEHLVRTDRGVERLYCSSAGADARFTSRQPDDYRIVIVPRERWNDDIIDLRS